MRSDKDIKYYNIRIEETGDAKSLRYYNVYKIHYDFESGGWYSEVDLKKTGEFKQYGRLSNAINYAVNLYKKHINDYGEDMDIFICEEIIETQNKEKVK